MAREPRVRDAQLSPVKAHAQTQKTHAATTRTRGASVGTKYKAIGLNKRAARKPTVDDISPTGDPHGKAVTARSVEEHALDTFGTVEKAEHWLNRPNPVLGGKTPRQVLQADPSWVEAELVRIDYGVYV